LTELLVGFRLHDSETDIAIELDDHTTVGQLADRLEQLFDRRGDVPRTIERLTRSNRWFLRDERISRCDLRSGDLIALALDTGLRATASAPPVASLRVVSGTDAGRVYELKRGESTIGRSAHCDITLNDDMASRRHATIRVTDIVEIADAGSTNGVSVDGAPIAGSSRLRPGSQVEVGDTVLVIDLIDGQSEVVDAVDNRVEFNRPPRLNMPYPGVEMELAPPPEQPRKPRLPMITAVIPLLMGAVLFLIFRSVLYVAFMALSPLMMVGSYFESKRTGRHDHRDRTAEWERFSSEQFETLDEARDAVVACRLAAHPGYAELLAHANDLSPRLWERQPEDGDFLQLRLGLRVQPSRTMVSLGQGGSRDDRAELSERAERYAELPPVPAVVDGRAHSPVGLSGPQRETRALARSLIVQAATLHSPDELVIAALVPGEEADLWEWLKWLPHTRSASNPLGRRSIAIGPNETLELLAHLNELVARRREHSSAGGQATVFEPHLLVVVANTVPLERARFARLLEHGHRSGVSVIWYADDARRLPKACRSVINVEPGGERVGLSLIQEGSMLGGIPIEGMSVESAQVVARTLAPIVDVSAGLDEGASIPQTVSMIELLGGLEVIEGPEAVLERWAQSAKGRGLRAPIGASEAGALNIDLRVDGPHGLVGGTTGAGKSELIQSLLVGLAASHSPERVNFLLIDYKGGAAFTDCVRMPHTVGLITDLTPALVQRALVSLQAELERRERILNRHQARDLIDMEQQDLPDTPPNLLIVIDEFAALVSEVPEFVDGVVDIAQRGRSLGMHLLLATQRPAGVITPNIRANTNLRVALRMASEDESNDVVAAPVAAHIERSNPGRGVVRRGPTDLLPFQSGYVGGVTTEEALAELEVGAFTLDGIDWYPNPGRLSATPLGTENDLRRLVRVLRRAARARGLVPPRRPWLEPLPATVDLLDLPRPDSDGQVPFALLDDPEHQTRSVAVFRPDRDGSILIYGTGGRGKTACLRTLGIALGLAKDRSPVEVHGLDFAGQGLTMLAPLPHVGTIIKGDDYGLVTRLLKVVRRTISERSERFAAARASSLSDYRRAADAGMARIVVLLDGFDNFSATYERIDRGQWLELFPRLVADGRQVGIHFVMTGTRRSSFPMAVASSAQARLVLKMASDDDFHSVGVNPRYFDDDSPPGRARFEDHDVQVSIVGGSPATANEDAAIRRLAAALVNAGARHADPIRVLPAVVTPDELVERTASGAVRWLLTEDFDTIGPSFDRNLLIAGPARSGRTTAITSLLAQCRAAGHTVLAAWRIASPTGSLTGITPPDLATTIEQLPDHHGLVLIDDADQLVDSPADMPLQRWIKTAPPETKFVVTMSTTAARKGYTPLVAAIRERADALVLNPDPAADADLLGLPLPGSPLPKLPGRGYTNVRQILEPVQVVKDP
jgi:S-DNA-T family DNA segregation ATPase FtsK/SpoIIIE